MSAQSILGRLDPAAIVMDPFPHIVAAEALAPDYYAALTDAFPDTATVTVTTVWRDMYDEDESLRTEFLTLTR